MHSDFDEDDTIPRAISHGEDEAAISTELPAVVFGDDDEVVVTAEEPRVRLLPGRVHEAWVLYPTYGLAIGAGLFAMQFSIGTREWSAPVVGLAWFLLYVWYWFYGVAYRYRRRVLKYSSVFVILGLTAALAYFSIERAAAQTAMIGMHELVEREEASGLYVTAAGTVLAAGLLLAHLVFLGRGYRRKKP